MCIGKTTLAGAVSGLLCKYISKYNRAVAVGISSLIIPIINTGVYMLGMVLMKSSVAQFLNLDVSTASVVFAVVFGIIWLNFIVEIIINTLFTPILYRVIKVIDKR